MKGVRLYISGLHQTVSEQDLKELFKPFGQIKNVQIARCKELNYQSFCRGFAHFEINFSSQEAQIRCLFMYNGCKWKSRRIQLELAHPSFRDRRLAEIYENNQSMPRFSNLRKSTEVKNFMLIPLNIAGRSRNTQIEVFCGISRKFDHSDEEKKTSYTANHSEIHTSLSTETRNTENIKASTVRRHGLDTSHARDLKLIDFEQESFSKSMKKKCPDSDKQRNSISSNFFRD